MVAFAELLTVPHFIQLIFIDGRPLNNQILGPLGQIPFYHFKSYNDDELRQGTLDALTLIII